MRSYIAIEKKKKGNATYYLLAGSYGSKIYNLSTLKSKLRNREIYVENLLEQNGKLNIQQIQGELQTESEFYYHEISNKIMYCSAEVGIMSKVVGYLKEVCHRDVDFDSNKVLIKDFLLMLSSFFNYLGKTNYTFLKTSYIDMVVFQNMDGINLYTRIESKGLSQNSMVFLTDWLNRGKEEPLAYKNFVSLLRDLVNDVQGNQKEIDNVLSILTDFFKTVHFSVLGGYLYQRYLLDMNDMFVNCIETHSNFNLPLINEDRRKEILEKSAGKDGREFEYNKRKIEESCRKLERLRRRYGDKTNELLGSLKLSHYSDLSSNDRVDLDSRLEGYYFEIDGLFSAVFKSFKSLSTNLPGVLESIETMEEIEDYSDVGTTKPFRSLKILSNAFSDLCILLDKGFNMIIKDALYFETYDLLQAYKNLSYGELGTLFYIVDRLRYKDTSPMRRKKLSWKSDMGIVPLLELFTWHYDFLAFTFSDIGSYTNREKRNFELAWLTSFYIVMEKVNQEIPDIDYYRGNLHLRYLDELLKKKNPNRNLENLDSLRYYISGQYGWKYDKDLKINLFEILKDV